MLMNGRFKNRREAGRILAGKLSKYAQRPDVAVLALPRGGVPVGHEVARALGAPLDVMLVRKLGVPGNEELAMGAVASGGVRFLNRAVIESLRITPEALDEVERRETLELMRREALYRGNRPPPPLARGPPEILTLLPKRIRSFTTKCAKDSKPSRAHGTPGKRGKGKARAAAKAGAVCAIRAIYGGRSAAKTDLLRLLRLLAAIRKVGRQKAQAAQNSTRSPSCPFVVNLCWFRRSNSSVSIRVHPWLTTRGAIQLCQEECRLSRGVAPARGATPRRKPPSSRGT